ncbi:MAG: enolase C-terminal domain-like protein [Bacteroidota bacterium]
MQIKLVHIYRVRIPFSFSVDHNLKKRTCSESLVLSLHTEHAQIGYGECTPRTYVTGERTEAVWNSFQEIIRHWPMPQIRRLEDIFDFCKKLEENFAMPSLVCAWEMALLDLWGKHQELPMATLLGGEENFEPQYSAVLPMLPRLKLEHWLKKIASLNLAHIKIKVGHKGGLDDLALARMIMGPDVDIRIDANRAWSLEEASQKLEEFQPFQISCVEEPLQADEIGLLSKLAQRTDIPLLLDESLCHKEELLFYLNEMSPDSFLVNLKISKLGGLSKCSEIYRLAHSHGVNCQLGCHVGETAILSAAGRIFAQHHQLKYLEGSFAPFFMEDDIAHQPIFFSSRGKADWIDGNGLGIEIDPVKLKRYSE